MKQCVLYAAQMLRAAKRSGVLLALCLLLSGLGLMKSAAADTAPAQEWTASYLETATSSGESAALALDAAGNVFVTGYAYPKNGYSDYVTVKIDAATGQPLWVTHYDGPAHLFDTATAIAVDGAGNVLVTGYSMRDSLSNDFDYATVKYDGATGQQLWAARYNSGFGSLDTARALAVDAAGNAYVTGSSAGSNGIEDYATLKYDGATGQQLWVARYNGPANYKDGATALALDSAGNVFVTGYSSASTNFGDYDSATVKYNGSTGQQLWVARYNSPGNFADAGNALAVDSADNVIVTGYSSTSTAFASRHYATLKYDGATGQQLWFTGYVGPANSKDEARAVAVDGAGDVLVTGTSTGLTGGTNYATVKYGGATGQQLWVARYAGSLVDEGRALALDSAGNVYVTGQSYWSGNASNATLKYDGMTGQQLWLVHSSCGPASALDADGAGNLYVTGDNLTVKYRQVLPTLTDVAVSNVTTSSATLTWNTSARSTSTVEYGTTPTFGSTAADGAYVTAHRITLTGLTPETPYYFRVSSGLVDGTALRPVSGTFTTLTGTFTISGKVMAAGAGLGGALVSGAGYTATSAADGTYTLEADAGTYLVHASYPGYTFQDQTVVVGPSRTGVDFNAPATISGRVTLAGTAAGGAVVSGGGQTVTTTADGSYAIMGLGAGSYLVHVSYTGYTFTDQTVVVGPSKTNVNFDAPATISGKVLVGGVGLAGAQVSGAGQTVTSAADGTYTLTGIYGGSYLVQAYAIGYTFANQTVQVGPSKTNVDFSAPADPALTGSYTISGKVTAGGVGLGGAVVSGAGQTVVTGADGSYALTNVGTGNYLVQAYAIGYTFANQTVQVGPSKSNVDFAAPADPALTGSYTISGRVLVGGVGLGGAVVAGAGRTVFTAADGSYTLTNVAMGSYLVQAYAIGYTFTDRTVLVGPSKTGVDFTAPFDPSLTGSYTISGKVLVGGVGLGGAVVSGVGQSVVTAPDGSYALSSVAMGSYLIQVYAIGYSFMDQTVLVGPSKGGVDFAAPFNPVLTGSYTVSGKVLVGGVGLGGAVVSGAGQTVVTGADGSYALTNVGTGNYLVQAYAIGYTFANQTVQVGPSKTGVDFAAP